MQIEDYSHLIYACRSELHRVGETWRSPRTLEFCQKVTGHKDANCLTRVQLESLLEKLQAIATVERKLQIGARVRVLDSVGVIRDWDEDFQAWLVYLNGELEMFDGEELDLAP